jgi:endo-1,3(4)-beta-glucanase
MLKNYLIHLGVKLKYVIAVVILLIISLTLFFGLKESRTRNTTKQKTTLVSLVDSKTLQMYPIKSNSHAVTTRIDHSIIPPTNSWISGMVLQADPLPVYPMPISILAKDTGYEVGLPKVRSTPTLISGPHQNGISVHVNSADSFKLTYFDKITATLQYFNQSKLVGSVTFSEGSPFVYYHSLAASTLQIKLEGTSIVTNSKNYVSYSKDGQIYAVALFYGASLQTNGNELTINTPLNSLVTSYPVPSSASDDSLRQYAGNEVISAVVSSSTQADQILTKISYMTRNNKDTVLSSMAYQKLINTQITKNEFTSIYGSMPIIVGRDLTTSVPQVLASNALDLSKLTIEHKNTMRLTLSRDVASTDITANDSYFAGKQLARAANLLQLAEQLNDQAAITSLKDTLNKAFSDRFNKDYFYYDPTLKGIAAKNNSFGSEDFNDHHFHYGYFIYAASIMGHYDSTFLQMYKNHINLLVADIATYSDGVNFPVQRYYDPYAAHSWAAGLAPFADGNNQESSSEAINAWSGVVLWAKLVQNKTLEDSGNWMLANETASSRSVWRVINTTDVTLHQYTSPIVSLNFGGKREYATFFSKEPNAKLGVQLIPLNPTMTEFKADVDSIQKNISASIQNDNFNVALGDYVLLYQALLNPQKALNSLETQTEAFIDNGNSRSYMEAWVYSLTDNR